MNANQEGQLKLKGVKSKRRRLENQLALSISGHDSSNSKELDRLSNIIEVGNDCSSIILAQEVLEIENKDVKLKSRVITNKDVTKVLEGQVYKDKNLLKL